MATSPHRESSRLGRRRLDACRADRFATRYGTLTLGLAIAGD